MTTSNLKSHTQKDGTVWEWEETPELKEFITRQQHVMQVIVTESLNEPPKRAS